MDEQEKFLKDLEPSEESILDLPLEPEKEEEKAEEKEEDEGELRNRRERRLASKLQAERESSIRLAERLSVLTEAKSSTVEDDYLKSVEKIYGTDKPENVMATEILKSALKQAEDRGVERAISAFREERAKETQAVAEEEQNLDKMIDDLEDTYNLDIPESKRKEFFKTLEKMSPKDDDGNVINYADHHAVWEIVNQKKIDNRAKDISSRSMVQSGASKESKLNDDSTARFLRENDII